jgi:uncharacterized protein YbjT (DUF2867 family)
LGSEICRRLAGRNHSVRALVRATSAREKVDALRAAGVVPVTGDLKDAASLKTAAAGVTAIVSTASSTLSRQPGDSIETVDLEGQLSLVEAARAAGAERFVFVSFRTDPQFQFPLSQAKRAVEKAIQDFNFTIIQASYFMEVWLSPTLGFDYANATARIYGGGENKISWVSFPDVAALCVATLESPGTERSVIEAGGPQALSPLEVVRTFEEESTRKFRLEHVPEEALRQQFDNAGDSLQKSFAGVMLGYARGDAMDMGPVLKRFPIPLTSVRDYARHVLPAQVASG